MNKVSKDKIDNTENENKNHEININEELEVVDKEIKEEKIISPEIMEQINYLNTKFEEKNKEYEEKILHLKKENLANLDNQKKQYEKDFENVKKYMFQKYGLQIIQ